jgi:hypothetical protein
LSSFEVDRLQACYPGWYWYHGPAGEADPLIVQGRQLWWSARALAIAEQIL